jgi:hypothetical protein
MRKIDHSSNTNLGPLFEQSHIISLDYFFDVQGDRRWARSQLCAVIATVEQQVRRVLVGDGFGQNEAQPDWQTALKVCACCRMWPKLS